MVIKYLIVLIKMVAVRQKSNDGLTHGSRGLLFLISEFIKNNGYSPTIRELAARKCCASPSAVQQQLARLKEEGYISMEYNRARTIKILKTKTDLGEV